MAKSKSWPRLKKEMAGKAVLKARIFVPEEESGGLEVSVDGAIPKGLAMLIAVQGLVEEPMTPEMDAHLLDIAKRRLLGQA